MSLEEAYGNHLIRGRAGPQPVWMLWRR